MLAVALVVALVVLLGRRPATRAAAGRPVLAVLPFENLGPAADAYFADGLTEEVRSRLASVAGLRVIGGTSARQYKGSTKPAREIARELGATHLLTGTVRWDRAPDGGSPGEGRVRVSPELVRAADQASVWAEPYEAPLKDVFQVQTRVAEQVATALDVVLLTGERRATTLAPPTRNLEAYDAYLRGRAYVADANLVSAPARREAIAAYERAIALDPRFAAAHARLAIVYLEERSFGQDTNMLDKARSSVARALTLDSALVESQLARAQLLTAEGDHAEAYRALRAAARLAPNDAEVVYWTGRAQVDLDRAEEAVASFQRAAVLEPRWSGPVGQLAGLYDQLSRYEEAIRAREREIALAPHDTWSYVFQAASHLLWRADTAAARRMLARGDATSVVELLARLPLAFAGRAIWLDIVPPAVLAAKDTLTLAGYPSANVDWPGTPDQFHLVKARHFAVTGRPERARAHADSIIALLEPALREQGGARALAGSFAPQATLAEAYAYAGRTADAARTIDRYVDDVRHGRGNTWELGPSVAPVMAAYVDALIGRQDLAATRLAEELRRPSGRWISRSLLQADPSWAPLRGHPGFERLIAGRR